MGMTIAEKIIALAAGVPEDKGRRYPYRNLDRMMSNDGTTHLTVDMYNNKLKTSTYCRCEEDGLYRGSQCSGGQPKTAASQKKMRDFARENNIDFWEGRVYAIRS